MKGKVKSKKSVSQSDFKDALVKKALGYDCTEVVEEYVSGDEGEIRLTKKKVTKKNVPPDITAIKLLIDQTDQPIEELSDEQLEVEKQRLLKLLKEYEN
ncbi:MAG: hypothetical protein E7346_00330 [Clostridiales bacterium]|nr:hypothetical protein [Clostridiales bacterium]MBQ3046559.1 hypothetical protein [Clostridia bacterium]